MSIEFVAVEFAPAIDENVGAAWIPVLGFRTPTLRESPHQTPAASCGAAIYCAQTPPAERNVPIIKSADTHWVVMKWPLGAQTDDDDIGPSSLRRTQQSYLYHELEWHIYF